MHGEHELPQVVSAAERAVRRHWLIERFRRNALLMLLAQSGWSSSEVRDAYAALDDAYGNDSPDRV